MRILKYIFLLLLLSLVTLSIFVATKKGDFTVERSQILNSPKPTVFNFINDFKNWEDFGPWMVQDSLIKIKYTDQTIGSGASYSWQGKEGSGTIKTFFVKENDSIAQKMNYNGTESSVFWSFKDTLGGTKITLKTIGKMSFSMKVYTAFNGGINRIIGTMYEKSLANIEKTLDFEINTYSVKVQGITKIPATFYLKQTFTSEIAKVVKNSSIVFNKITTFCEQNSIELNGKPFIIYHTYDTSKGLTRLSFCIPIKNEIFTSSGSDILSAKLQELEAIKTTLTGDYSHTKKALDKAKKYSNINKIEIDTVFSHLEIYKISKLESKNPSGWVTEIYYPIKPTVLPVSSYVPAAIKKLEAIKNSENKNIKEAEKSEF